MIKNITEKIKRKREYQAAMMKLSVSVTEKMERLLDAELARTHAETEAMEAVKQINSLISPEEMSDCIESISHFLTEMKQPHFQENFYQTIIDAARQQDQTG